MNKIIKFSKRIFHYIWLHKWMYHTIVWHQRVLVKKIRKRNHIRVVFTALDQAMWRYQHIYDLLSTDKRFQVYVVLTPSPLRDYEKDMNGLRMYFSKRGINYIDYNKDQPFDIKKELNPDLIFFTQPYEDLLLPEHDYRNFLDRLICYMPYSFWTATGKSSYNLPFHNMAWRLYYPTSMHKNDAKKIAENHGRNVRVVGYANTDDYLRPQHPSPWKSIEDGKLRKKIIWAPHFTITSNSLFPPRSNFLWMANYMLDIANDYADKIQLAFKPHPFLLSHLYLHKDWGKKRAEDYYNLWDSMPNTQLETGEYGDLFMNSDAMIHDSYSFTAEYHYSKNPVLFITKDANFVRNGINDFGKLAFDMQYIGSDEKDIRNFIDNVVLNETDPMRQDRESFYSNFLLPPNGKSVAENVVDDIIESLRLQ